MKRKEEEKSLSRRKTIIDANDKVGETDIEFILNKLCKYS